MEHRWNKIDRGKPKYSGKSLFQCHFDHHNSHMDCPGIEQLSYWAQDGPHGPRGLISWKLDDDDDDDGDGDTVYQGSTNVFRDGPESKYFRLHGPRGRSKVKDIYKIRKHRRHKFI
jgi:hypothetical protein